MFAKYNMSGPSGQSGVSENLSYDMDSNDDTAYKVLFDMEQEKKLLKSGVKPIEKEYQTTIENIPSPDDDRSKSES